MKRLSDRWMFYCGLLVGMNASVEDLKHIQDLIDAEEQGLLLRLPCKKGTMVYEITGVEWKGYDWKYPSYEKARVRKTIFTLDKLSDFSKTVFLTEQEAEAKLIELQSEVADNE